MSLKTDEILRCLAEALAAFDGKGPESWREYAYEAARSILVQDTLQVARKKEEAKRKISSLS